MLIIILFGLFSFLSLLNITTSIAYLMPQERRKDYYPSVSMIVRFWNDGPVFKRCIDGLLNQNYPKGKLQIIAVDDGSDDGTKELAKKYGKKIIYFRSEKHYEKKAILVDRAIKKYVSGEVIVEVDADTVCPKGWLKEMVKPFSDPQVGGVTGSVLCGNWYLNWITKIRAIENFWFFCISMFGRYKISGQGFLYGSSKAYTKKVWEEVGGNPTKTLVEDAELASKIISAGYRIVNLKSAVSLQEEVDTLPLYLSERKRWIKGNIDVFMKYKKELGTNRLQQLLLSSNFSLDFVSLACLVLSFVNPMFLIPLITNIFSVWIGLVRIGAKPIFYFFSIPYVVIGPLLQTWAVLGILVDLKKKGKVEWTKVWHHPTKLKYPIKN